jgi:hypothetical protein
MPKLGPIKRVLSVSQDILVSQGGPRNDTLVDTYSTRGLPCRGRVETS